MSMQKLSGIRNTGVYTAQRSMLEHLLFLETIVLQEEMSSTNTLKVKVWIAQEEYKKQNHINNPFNIQDIQHYLLATTEQDFSWEKRRVRGLYTSTLIEQAEGDGPITIDMLGNKIDYLLYAINTPRHLTINNVEGDDTGSYAGSHHGQANLTINNTKGDYTGESAGSHHGNARVNINNTHGHWTGAYAGRENGKAIVTINGTNGDHTGAWAGLSKGKAHLIIKNTRGLWTGERAESNAIIIGYNNKGEGQFDGNIGKLVLKNFDKTIRIEGVTKKQKAKILNLVAQNTPPEQIMDYLVKIT